MRKHSHENDFDLHENETAYRTHFHMKSFALRLVLKQRHKRTRKWPIGAAEIRTIFFSLIVTKIDELSIAHVRRGLVPLVNMTKWSWEGNSNQRKHAIVTNFFRRLWSHTLRISACL